MSEIRDAKENIKGILAFILGMVISKFIDYVYIKSGNVIVSNVVGIIIGVLILLLIHVALREKTE